MPALIVIISPFALVILAAVWRGMTGEQLAIAVLLLAAVLVLAELLRPPRPR